MNDKIKGYRTKHHKCKFCAYLTFGSNIYDFKDLDDWYKFSLNNRRICKVKNILKCNKGIFC